MKNNTMISSDLLKELQTTYKHFPKRTNTLKNETQFDSGLKELTTSYGRDFSLKPGEILFEQGDAADGLYWIKEGILVVLDGDLKKPRLLTFRKAGHIVGEIALLEETQRTASVVAITEVQLKYLDKEKFQGLLSLIPNFGLELMRVLSARLREIKPAEYSSGMYDHLTSALSRQAFDIRLVEEIERAQLYRYNFSIVFIDLDNFKEINDSYGHGCGDEVLIAFAKRIMSGLRTTDLLFRYGGDEFVLILQGIDETRGAVLVQKLLDDMKVTPIIEDPPITLAFSAGMSYYPTDGELPNKLLETADQRVYHAKKQGRGQVVANKPDAN
ncbi:MAG: GGDEF domain-containing protein [Anaerolineae bacterium]|jgi:diguanylate cyclase (GGDEF)-like protein|nr:GGDEF domain-containing protein [Anaerolineae bacterium]MBT7991615.1 GGDEF domain-containing protein [Anaerolineae bacterium]